MSVPWPPPRPERRHYLTDHVTPEDRRKLAGVLERLHWLEAELDFLEAQQRRRRRRQIVAGVVLGLVLALVLL
jgi:hypothetical protein